MGCCFVAVKKPVGDLETTNKTLRIHPGMGIEEYLPILPPLYFCDILYPNYSLYNLQNTTLVFCLLATPSIYDRQQTAPRWCELKGSDCQK